MKIIITRPAQPIHKFEQKFLDHWAQVSDLLGTKPVIVQNEPYETHGALLTRIWNDLRTCKEPILISESDFWAYADEVEDLLRHAQRLQRAACFTPLARRLAHPLPSGMAPTDALGSLKFYEPLVAPWFMLLLPSNFQADPPLTWLQAAGPFNDAANCAYLRGVEAGAFLEHNVKWLQKTKALGPVIRGNTAVIQYLHGTHFFFTRHWHDNPETLLLPGGYTVGAHLAVIETWLEQRLRGTS